MTEQILIKSRKRELPNLTESNSQQCFCERYLYYPERRACQMSGKCTKGK